MTVQLDLFTAPANQLRRSAAAPADPLNGLVVQLSDRCRCGSCHAVIGEGKGPHRASLFCARCEGHRGWMPNEAHAFVAEVIRKFGKPKVPIRIQRSKTNKEA
jgi:hypothetical protein